MGHHNLPADYDAWRLAPPWDDAPRPPFDMVEDDLVLDLPEGTIETIGTYDADSGALVSARIAGHDVPAAAIEAFVGPVEWARVDVMDPDRLSDLCADAMRDAALDHADYLNDLREDR